MVILPSLVGLLISSGLALGAGALALLGCLEDDFHTVLVGGGMALASIFLAVCAIGALL